MSQPREELVQRPVAVPFLVPVLECGGDVHAYIQPDLFDAAAWPLEWVPSVPCAHAPGLPFQFLDCHK